MELQQRRRERFKKGVVVTVAAVVALLVVLLIEGCMSEHAKSSNASTTAVASLSESRPSAAAVAKPKPASTAPTNAATPAPVAPKKVAAPSVNNPADLLYVVKPGDTLNRIALNHRTTVKALKLVNGLESDTIIVGAKLKLPSA